MSMKAIVVEHAGAPDVLQVRTLPRPQPRPGWVLDAMEVQPGQSLLVRGGTSSVGMAAIALAKDKGLQVLATTRNEEKREALRENGADDVVIDTGQIADEVKRRVPGGVNGLLELIGTVTLLDSLQAVAPKGMVCFT